MTEKKYKLLKDTVLSKKGQIFTLNDAGNQYFWRRSDNNLIGEIYSKEEVENNPDWFRLIEDKTETAADLLFDFLEKEENLIQIA